MQNVVFVYMTTGSRQEAERIGSALVQERLAACVNLFEGMTSMYWWEGQVQQDSETVLIAKTRAERFEALRSRVVELHSYECPCVVALPVETGHAPFLNWIGEQATAS